MATLAKHKITAFCSSISPFCPDIYFSIVSMSWQSRQMKSINRCARPQRNTFPFKSPMFLFFRTHSLLAVAHLFLSMAHKIHCIFHTVCNLLSIPSMTKLFHWFLFSYLLCDARWIIFIFFSLRFRDALESRLNWTCAKMFFSLIFFRTTQNTHTHTDKLIVHLCICFGENISVYVAVVIL